MAGVSGTLESSAGGDAASSSPEWVVGYSRFFHFPRPCSFSSLSPRPLGLRPLPKGKLRSRGTWLAASSPAILRIFGSSSYTYKPVLSLSLSGVVHEEHFVANLNFSWPQVSCASECPIRGSRAVFMSYKDSSNLIQKFAVRFPTCCVAEMFLKYVKECPRETMAVGLLGSDLVHENENDSPSEFIANGLHYRVDEQSNFGEPIATCAPETSVLTYNNEQSEHTHLPAVGSNTVSILTGFPPSFSELLASCSTSSEQEETSQTWTREVAHPPPQDQDKVVDPFHGMTNSKEQLGLLEESDLKSQIVLSYAIRCYYPATDIYSWFIFTLLLQKYMSDASFVDLLTKIEKVIDELGGDMSL